MFGAYHAFYSVNQALKQFFFIAELVSVVDQESDFVITKAAISKALNGKNQKQLSSGPCRMTLIKYPEKHSIPTLLICSRGRIVQRKWNTAFTD
jgi:hypothetical protein